MTLPDNRIRFPSARIDFETDVGITNQDHDDYPPPGGQARFDHMRMFLSGLLAQQSSLSEPTQKREGTPWFDLNTATLKIWYNGEWKLYSEMIPLTDSVNLKDWYDTTSEALSSLSQEIFFGGVCSSDSVFDITIPESLRDFLHDDSRAFVTVNETTNIDPRTVQFIGSPVSTLRLSSILLDNGDTFTVTIKRIPDETFLTANVSIP